MKYIITLFAALAIASPSAAALAKERGEGGTDAANPGRPAADQIRPARGEDGARGNDGAPGRPGLRPTAGRTSAVNPDEARRAREIREIKEQELRGLRTRAVTPRPDSAVPSPVAGDNAARRAELMKRQEEMKKEAEAHRLELQKKREEIKEEFKKEVEAKREEARTQIETK